MKNPVDFIISVIIIAGLISVGWIIAIPVFVIIALINNSKSDT